MNIYLTLFFEFFKTGLFAVGGGLATLPFLTEMANKYPWLTSAQLADMIAVAESTPGPIGVNCATYAGYNAAGVLGALTATFALVLPSFIVILIISKFLAKYRESRLVDSAFAGLRPAVTGLIGATGLSVLKMAVVDVSAGATFLGLAGFSLKPVETVLFVLIMVVSNLKWTKKLHPLVFIGFAAAVGIIFGL